MACNFCAPIAICVTTNCRRVLASLIALTFLLLASDSFAQSSLASASGSSDRSYRQLSLKQIPWKALDKDEKNKIQAVVSKPTMYRHMPTRVVDCDLELYSMLLDHPELVVDVWGVMGISKLQVEKVGPHLYDMTDSTGTVGKVEVLYADKPNEVQEGKTARMLIFARGVYDAPPLPRAIHANSVMLLRSTPITESNGRTYVKTELDSFIQIKRSAAELILKAINPLVAKTADHNFVETMRFVSMFSQTAEKNPEGMARLATHLTKVDEPTRREFIDACNATAKRSAQRAHNRRINTASLPNEMAQPSYR